MHKTDIKTLANAVVIMAKNFGSEDGVVETALIEAADRLLEQDALISKLKKVIKEALEENEHLTDTAIIARLSN